MSKIVTDFSDNSLPGENISAGDIKKALKEAGAKSSQLHNIPIEEIGIIDDFNVRNETSDYEEHIEMLAGSIMENGFLLDKPLSGYVRTDGDGDKIVIYDGHSRLKAAKIALERGAPVQTLPVVIRNDNNIVDLNCSLITNNSGRDLTDIEKAYVVKRLHRFQLSQSEISQKTGIARTKVNGFLVHLIPAPPQIHNWIIEDKITASLAIKIIRKHKANAVNKIKKMIEKADAKGDKKAFASHSSDANFKRYMRKRAPEMTNMITKISENQKLLDAIKSVDPALHDSLMSVANEGREAMKEMLEG